MVYVAGGGAGAGVGGVGWYVVDDVFVVLVAVVGAAAASAFAGSANHPSLGVRPLLSAASHECLPR